MTASACISECRTTTNRTSEQTFIGKFCRFGYRYYAGTDPMRLWCKKFSSHWVFRIQHIRSNWSNLVTEYESESLYGSQYGLWYLVIRMELDDDDQTSKLLYTEPELYLVYGWNVKHAVSIWQTVFIYSHPKRKALCILPNGSLCCSKLVNWKTLLQKPRVNMHAVSVVTYNMRMWETQFVSKATAHKQLHTR